MQLLKERFSFRKLFQGMLLINEIFMFGKYYETVSPRSSVNHLTYNLAN